MICCRFIEVNSHTQKSQNQTLTSLSLSLSLFLFKLPDFSFFKLPSEQYSIFTVYMNSVSTNYYNVSRLHLDLGNTRYYSYFLPIVFDGTNKNYLLFDCIDGWSCYYLTSWQMSLCNQSHGIGASLCITVPLSHQSMSYYNSQTDLINWTKVWLLKEMEKVSLIKICYSITPNIFSKSIISLQSSRAKALLSMSDKVISNLSWVFSIQEKYSNEVRCCVTVKLWTFPFDGVAQIQETFCVGTG